MPFTRPWDVTTVLTPTEQEATERTPEGLVLIVLGPTVLVSIRFGFAVFGFVVTVLI